MCNTQLAYIDIIKASVGKILFYIIEIDSACFLIIISIMITLYKIVYASEYLNVLHESL